MFMCEAIKEKVDHNNMSPHDSIHCSDILKPSIQKTTFNVPKRLKKSLTIWNNLNQ